MAPIRAIALISGGLDSALAARLLLDQGIEVVGLHLESPTACRSDVRALARELGIPLEVRPKGEEYLRILRRPRYGRGRNMNPCVDCRVFMLRIAVERLEPLGASFIATGEVAGQRPMSQGRHTLELIDREAGVEGRVLRPLSARVLPETEPERRGLVDRARLLAISGRGRTEQLELATRLGLSHYESPGGGCLLTDARFSIKLRDLLENEPEESTTMSDVALLRIGRHFRLAPGVKVVLGRDARENERLAGLGDEQRWTVEPEGFNGPTALVCGPREDGALDQAAGLIARYSRDPGPAAQLRWRHRAEEGTIPLPASPAIQEPRTR
jgi:hypothetical protein